MRQGRHPRRRSLERGASAALGLGEGLDTVRREMRSGRSLGHVVLGAVMLAGGLVHYYERRRFYVAATRAKDRLILTHVRVRAGRDTGGPSRFLCEAGLLSQPTRQAA